MPVANRSPVIRSLVFESIDENYRSGAETRKHGNGGRCTSDQANLSPGLGRVEHESALVCHTMSMKLKGIV